MELTSLTHAVLLYQYNGVGQEELIRRIAQKVYTYPRGRMGWNEDDCSDFFCDFFPKLPNLVKRFTFQGKPFEAYLCTTLKWQLKSFATRKSQNTIKARMVTEEGFGSVEACYSEPVEIEMDCVTEAPPRYSSGVREVLRIDMDGRIRDEVSRKRLLFLAMKGAFYVDGNMLGRVAEVTGYRFGWLVTCAEELVCRLGKRRERLSLLRVRRNHCYFRIYYIHERLAIEIDMTERTFLFRNLNQERFRLTRLIEEINRIPLAPTHHDIADVLSVPKGSVDSALYYLRNQLRKRGLLEEWNIN